MSKMLMNKRQHNEDGLVSIIVVSVVIIILSLMTAGFAKIMDRELRKSLDRELAVQANYAAEAGMNDARNYVMNTPNPDTGGDCLNTASLTAAQQPYFVNNGSISSTTGAEGLVKYTCVNIDTQPKELLYDRIPAGQSKIVKIVTSDVLDKLYFSWNNTGASASTNSTALPGIGSFPEENHWSAAANQQATGVLRTTIYPVSPAATSLGDQDAALESLARTYFMYPNASASGSITDTPYVTNNGTTVPGNCNQTNYTTAPAQLPYKQSKHYCNSAISNMSPVTPPTPTPNNDFRQGRQYSACDEFQPPVANDWPCTQLGNGVYSMQNYSATYDLSEPAGTYDLTIRYGNYNAPGWPWPPSVAWNYNIHINVNGVRVVSNWGLPVSGSVATRNIGSLPANADITVIWDNNDFIPPSNWDPNFLIERVELDEIVSPPSPLPANHYYYVRLTALYRDLTVSLQGANAAGDSVNFRKAQAVIDVTAKGNDVLKRLQGRVSLEPDFDNPQYALESMDSLCKRLRVEKTGPSTYGNTRIDDVFGGVLNADGACKP